MPYAQICQLGIRICSSPEFQETFLLRQISRAIKEMLIFIGCTGYQARYFGRYKNDYSLTQLTRLKHYNNRG